MPVMLAEAFFLSGIDASEELQFSVSHDILAKFKYVCKLRTKKIS